MWQGCEGLSGEKSRGGRCIRKWRGARKRRRSRGEEWEMWAELMDGEYYTEEIMRGRDNLMRGVTETGYQC